uniref:RING-type E3 ubiquitin transferase n=1 Tax=Davidia involucrata TaxID=16924 RepID=A0A5B7C8K5_DAVIN
MTYQSPLQQRTMGSDDRNKVGSSLKMLLAAMFSLLGIAILIAILQICARYILRREERRRRAILFSTIEAAISEENSSEPPKSGVDQSVIESLPMFNYKANDQGEAKECSVCLNTIVEEALVRLLPNCKHLFHADCIGMWLSSHTTCPNCRTLAAPPDTGVQPTAPPLDEITPNGAAELEKVGGSGSRLSSFRRMLGRERSSRRTRSCGEEAGSEDLEMQGR